MGGTQLMIMILGVCSTCLCIHMNPVVPGGTTGTRSGMMFMDFLQQPGSGPGSGRRWSRWAGEKHTETPPAPDLWVGRESDLESDLGSSSFPAPLLPLTPLYVTRVWGLPFLRALSIKCTLWNLDIVLSSLFRCPCLFLVPANGVPLYHLPFCCCDKTPPLKATRERKNLFGLKVLLEA